MTAELMIAREPTLATMDSVSGAFSVVGENMRLHKGRSVVRIPTAEATYFLKRFWLAPSQLFKGHVRRGFHELRMIDWLNTNGFAGPRVVRRGWSGRPPFCRRLYFLMEEVEDELPLEAAWTKFKADRDDLMNSLASFAARLHDARFIHTDFSERHILVGRRSGSWTFRLIDVERASIGCAPDHRVADDLATLTASVMNDDLRASLRNDFLEIYAANRPAWSTKVDIHSVFAKGRPTKSF